MSMKTYKRLMEMDRLLRLGQRFTLKDLSDKFDVNERTIQRDIEALRKEFKAPLVYDFKSRIYVYKTKTYSLPRMAFTEEDLFNILVAERALQQYKGVPFNVTTKGKTPLHDSFNKLVQLLPDGEGVSAEVADLCNAITFDTPFPVSEINPALFSLFAKAVAKRQMVKMVYQFLKKKPNENAEIEICPYNLANWGGDWYLVGQSKNFGKITNYHFAQIRSAELVDKYFVLPESFDPRQYMATVFGKMRFSKIDKIVLRLHPPTSSWMKVKTWKFIESVKEHECGSVTMVMKAVANNAMKNWVLQFGSQIEVLKPMEFREQIAKELQKASNAYEISGK